MNNFNTQYGSFSSDGKEYIINRVITPKPWVNIITNGRYGMVISQAGGGFSWLDHSEFNRLNRWHQDLIKDDWGKYFYFSNNKTGEVWSPVWMPVKKDVSDYQCRFGHGYAVFSSVYGGIKVTLTVFIPTDENLEIWKFKIENGSKEELDLSIVSYFEWCLGSSSDFHREFHKTFIETEFSKAINSLVATKKLWEIPLGDRGHWNIEYPYYGFISSNKTIKDFEAEKENFIGKYGSLDKPRSVTENSYSRETGRWGDPIAAVKADTKITAGENDTVVFFLGIGENKDAIGKSLNKYKSEEAINDALDKVKANWESLLTKLAIDTPDEAMNLMVNRWLRYQAIAGRLWARTAYYQQSGAFGFRDQLQDSLVFLPLDPSLTLNQIRLHARHQFEDGTVLHWWHPISETGLATQMTDDLLWLPYITYHYIIETGDYSIFDIKEPYYNSEKEDTILNHCYEAIDKVLTRMSPRGLPLIGAGDWNDGFSAVGLEMKGESVWLAEFLYDILNKFKIVSKRKGNEHIAVKYAEKAELLKKAFNEYAWDGEYYWGATKDSGEKILSKESQQSKIYLNAQTWSVISSIAPEEKKKAAMEAVTKNLLKDYGTLLLNPAYSIPDKYIGYLTRYAPGRRENGGTYTHAATWSVWAYALMKQPEQAYESYKRINPVLNGMDPDKYSAEPYVTPGNIEGPDSPKYGMGGWTWYTGSASWYQKVIVDFILGVRAVEDGLLIDPCIPKEWNSYSVKRIYRDTTYNIKFINSSGSSFGVKEIKLDGVAIEGNVIKPQSKAECNVEVYL
ncbi:MAG: glycosyl transferase family 36 [Ignavibacteriaceae bacterium]|nr:glycosyl transferase family 36 [Ignavibacteriaceae bacterium]